MVQLTRGQNKMTHLVKKSYNSYHVIVGEVIDHTETSLKHVSEFLWEGVNSRNQSKKFKTKNEAILFAMGN